MSKIATYSLADTPLQLSDRLIGTEAPRTPPSSTPLATKNFSLGELLQLFSDNFPAASLQAVLDTGNTATQNINLAGTIQTTLIKPNNIEDTSGSQGTTFQFLSKGTSSINWVDLPVDNLQAVLDKGNTATQNIILTGNISSTKIIPGNIQDDSSGIGTTGQILSKTSTGIRWINNPTVLTPGLADVLSVGNTANNNIILSDTINSIYVGYDSIAFQSLSGYSHFDSASIFLSTGASVAQLDSSYPMLLFVHPTFGTTNLYTNLTKDPLANLDIILPATSGTLALTSDVPPIESAALTRTNDTNVTLTLGGTPDSALLQAVSLTLGWTGTLADSRIASATAWNSKEPGITAGTTSQYWRGDKTWQTLPTVGTWGALNYPNWSSGTPFVKMTAAGTFALDTNTYVTTANAALQNAYNNSTNGKILLDLIRGAFKVQGITGTTNIIEGYAAGQSLPEFYVDNVCNVIGKYIYGTWFSTGFNAGLQDNSGTVQFKSQYDGIPGQGRWETNQRINYLADYSSLYSNRSLIDKGYADTTYVPKSRTLTINGVTYDLSADRSWTISTYSLPISSSSILGGVKIGSGVSITGDGTISVSTNYQSPLSGTGFVKISGTTISYDNNTYVPYSSYGTNNISANNFFDGFTSVVASGTQIVLTVNSTPSYLITGSGGQTIKLPDATTLPNGTDFYFNNNQSSGAISVNNNSNTLVKSVPSGGYLTITLIDNSTAAGNWDTHFQSPSNVSWSTNTFDYSGSITSATWNGVNVALNRGGTGANTASGARTNLGSTTVGDNFFTLTNPSSITFPRINADNTVSTLDASTFRTAIGAQGATSRRNANNSTNSAINYCGVAQGSGVVDSSSTWTVYRLTVASDGTVVTATATNITWTSRESAIYT